MWIPSSLKPEMPSTEQSESKIEEKSFCCPSTKAATQSCFLPSMSITISPAVIPDTYSLTVPSGSVTEIIDIDLPPPPSGALLPFTLTIISGLILIYWGLELFTTQHQNHRPLWKKVLQESPLSFFLGLVPAFSSS